MDIPDVGHTVVKQSNASNVNTVSVADVLAAQARLRRYLMPTPIHYAERFGVMLKLENLQRTGSYKVRGALNAMLVALERGDNRPVICASAGNHAQGVAWSAYRLGIQAITVMPHGAPATKVAGVSHWGQRYANTAKAMTRPIRSHVSWLSKTITAFYQHSMIRM